MPSPQQATKCCEGKRDRCTTRVKLSSIDLAAGVSAEKRQPSNSDRWARELGVIPAVRFEIERRWKEGSEHVPINSSNWSIRLHITLFVFGEWF